MNANDIFEKQELENKLKGFEEGKDYSISSVEDSKQVYELRSDELKQKFGSNLVYCRIEKYDGQDFRYRGRFEGYENGDFYSSQEWQRGQNFKPEEHPNFSSFDDDWKRVVSELDSPFIANVAYEIGNIKEGWGIRNSREKGSRKVWKTEKEQGFSYTFFSRPDSVNKNDNFDNKLVDCHNCGFKEIRPSDNYCQMCGIQVHLCDGTETSTSLIKRNIEDTCFDCGKPSEARINQSTSGRNSIQGDGHFRCSECNDKYINHLQEKLIKEGEKNQRIANLEEQNKNLNQQLATELQNKQEAERQAEQERNNLQTELKKIREELTQTQEKLVQLQKELEVKVEKTPDSNTEKAVEQLAKTHQELKKVEKLSQKTNPNDKELNTLREQLDNSQRVIAAAAAHQQSALISEKHQPQAEVNSVASETVPVKKNYAPYLISGSILVAVAALGIGYWLRKNKK